MAERREKEDLARQGRDRLMSLLEGSQWMIEDQSQKRRKPNGLLSRLFGRPAVTGVLLAVILISGTALAYAGFGVGAESCGQVTNNEGVQKGMRSWVGGYLTAYSLWVEEGSGPVTDGDVVGPWAWINNYCQENPLETLAEAAEQLIYAIRDK